MEPNESEEVEHSPAPETVQRPTSSPVPERVYQAIESAPAYPGRSDYEVKPRNSGPCETSVREARVVESFKRNDWVESKPAPKPNHNKETNNPAVNAIEAASAIALRTKFGLTTFSSSSALDV